MAGLLAAATEAQAAPASHHAGLAKAQAAAKSALAHPKLGPGGRVIVLLKNHETAGAAKTTAERTLARAARTTQTRVVADVRKAGGKVTHSYSLINGFSATVTQAQADKIAANSSVQEVVPDALIKSPSVSAAAAAASGVQPPTAPPANTCKPNGATQLEPEALEATHADSDVAGAKTARSLGYTGKGVTVAWIADGLDINNPDFQRNGKSIFTDYQDFSGDGTNSPTGGDEAFLDASAIAAQGNQTYDISKFSALPLNEACNIRIEGEAPGVNLVGLNIFGDEDAGYNSSFIQAIQYAADVDHVNVLNESLGSNPFPDDAGSLDAVKAANDAAVAKGVTITASSGDAGVTSTIGSPATDPNVISVGASTTYRFYLQTGYGGARLPGITGYLDNNISDLSSGGYDQSARTVNLVAPGDLNWALCTANATQYSECTDFLGNPSNIEESGGTSESAPVTAGIAALVIEAYRNGHSGSSPSPAVVKTILTSTADDIQAPAQQQGAGLVDAYKAVQLAKSYKVAARTGHTIISSANNFGTTVKGNKAVKFTDTITNAGTSTQKITTSTRAIGAFTQVRNTSVTLSDAKSKKYVDFQGITDNYEKITFTVPNGEKRLNADIAFKGASVTDLAARVRMDLVDPKGRLASYSLPQGIGNYGNSQVSDPVAGTWTAYIESRDSADGGTQGKVLFSAGVAKFVTFGKASPKTLTLKPGQSGKVTLSLTANKKPGDKAGSLVLTSGTTDAGIPATTTVPVTVRTLVPTGKESFTDVLTGGNGRDANTGETFYYALNVPKGKKELNASIRLSSGPANQFFAYLVAPSGNALASAANDIITSDSGGTDPKSKSVLGAQLHVLSPAKGRWTLIVDFAPTVNGKALRTPFTVQTDQTAVPVTAKGLPTSKKTKIKSGSHKTVYVTVKNVGTSPEAFFVDPRLTSSTTYNLYSPDPSTEEPLRYSDPVPQYLVPSETTKIAGAAESSNATKIQFDMGAASGDPDVVSGQGSSEAVSYAAKPVTPGVWTIAPTEIGPYPVAGPVVGVDTAMLATTRKFDTSIRPATGDLWQTAINPKATLQTITVNGGQTATIPVKIYATGKARTVKGTLFVDDADNFLVFGGTSPNANEVAALSYTYSVTKK